MYFKKYEAFDGIFFNQTHQTNGCKDIAAQLIDDNSFINVNFVAENFTSD